MIVREKDVKSIMTKSPVHSGYTASPYNGCEHRCMYCYASYLAEWQGHLENGERWGEYIDVKNWKPFSDREKEQFHGKKVFISSATDPYQSAELEHGRTRKLLEDLRGLDMDVLIVTKSKNVLRDIGLFRELGATVALSINTLDERFRRDMDGASTIAERIEALSVLHDSNVHSVCFMSPIFPGVTDAPSIIEAVTGKCDAVYLEHLVLNGKYKHPILYYIRTKYPEYYYLYDEIFVKGNYDRWKSYDDFVEEWAKQMGYEYSYSKFPKEHREKPVLTNFKGHKGK